MNWNKSDQRKRKRKYTKYPVERCIKGVLGDLFLQIVPYGRSWVLNRKRNRPVSTRHFFLLLLQFWLQRARCFVCSYREGERMRSELHWFFFFNLCFCVCVIWLVVSDERVPFWHCKGDCLAVKLGHLFTFLYRLLN